MPLQAASNLPWKMKRTIVTLRQSLAFTVSDPDKDRVIGVDVAVLVAIANAGAVFPRRVQKEEIQQ